MCVCVCVCVYACRTNPRQVTQLPEPTVRVFKCSAPSPCRTSTFRLFVCVCLSNMGHFNRFRRAETTTTIKTASRWGNDLFCGDEDKKLRSQVQGEDYSAEMRRGCHQQLQVSFYVSKRRAFFDDIQHCLNPHHPCCTTTSTFFDTIPPLRRTASAMQTRVKPRKVSRQHEEKFTLQQTSNTVLPHLSPTTSTGPH